MRVQVALALILIGDTIGRDDCLNQLSTYSLYVFRYPVPLFLCHHNQPISK
jgi:hypothetical protein